MKKVIIACALLFFISTSISFSKNDLYEKIDLFGEVLENIKKDPKMAEPLIEGTDYINSELIEAAEREMIVTLEDFLRRRSKLALVVQHEDLKKSQGLREACKILFDEDASERWEEYFGERF